ncbi:pyrroloquinoline quinone biosynthesis peptide chaperone PqqD [Acetobacter orleanensis]|uniref:Coenzyme PQQ synthesis protein D n=1 Tax=Acetobacter orleanensis TaxID=104099 RepID=A0A4Y3TM48_9PROT|nr:pyrroloquinoline quinone biosynthesis peptide chaperone PqqD [Acetobacter orleanensis]KXV62531.1 pyrroloquinoline quinone biosynthesis protein PqqD [Acetobacter orleanensis]PCD80035.1 pyrroloquinoline quinone biosynthesis peptide chaperone PqqD [Acetobacter orleanensis]GAN68350.1 coenzyme pyrrolo-quinoline quinone (PQQ) synthesis protein D PqqD [Acetobacter orleanensis JCM 7639]GBR29751.1 pyrrolo-quinoline quinone synthesis protein PqqD [Acetobacter orleanensis NRIC 0473]GEB82803.1 hypothet
MTSLAGITEGNVPRFVRGTRLQYDRVREQWFVQAPERAFLADAVAAEILQLVNGKHSLGQIIDQLTEKFSAPRDVIVQDVLSMTQELADKQVLLLA